MIKPIVSIIMNCYNSEKYLREAIESVINQTYTDWELIFWDNQSTDNSALIFNSFDDSRLCYYYSDTFLPLSDARNKAIEKASGNLIAFVDCDDIWYSRKLEKQVFCFEDSTVGIVYSPFEIMLSCNSNLGDFYKRIIAKCTPHIAMNIYNRLLKGNYIIFSSVLIRKIIFDKTGGFNSGLSQNEDYEILLKLSLYTNAVCIKNSTVKYRVHQNNNSYLNGEKNFLENRIIYSNLPVSKELSKAINRNELRYVLYLLFFKKNIKGLLLLRFNYIPFIIEMVIMRIINIIK